MSAKVYKWQGSYGRGGSLEGLFVATAKSVEDALGRLACFGEALGKHSDVREKLTADAFTVLSEDPAVIAFVEEHGPFGRNPLDYITVDCDECGGNMRIAEEQDYWCKDCEMRICYACTKCDDNDQHEGCEIVEYEGQEPSETEETDEESE